MNRKRTFSRIIMLIKPYKFMMLLSILFAGISVALMLYVPILIGDAVDITVGKGKVDFVKLSYVLLKIAGCIVVVHVVQWVMSLCNNKITYCVVNDVRSTAFEKMLNIPLTRMDQVPHGDMMNRVIQDVEQFADGLLMGFSQLFTGIATIVGTLVFMLFLSPFITLFVVVLTPLSLFAARFIAKRTYVMFQVQSQVRGTFTSYVEEFVGNQKTVKTFSYEEEAKKGFHEINEQLQVSSLRSIFYSSITNPTTRFVNGIVYGTVGVLGGFLAINGQITIGQVSCFLSYANQYTKPFNEISGVITEFQNALASAARVFQLIDEPQEQDTGKDIDFVKKGNVSMKDVSFSYDKKVPFIQELNIEVKAGNRIAIVGETGCGKTTLINLLMGFYEVDQGEIAIDGVEICKMSRNQLRTCYGLVLQDTWLKTGTISENIGYGRPFSTKEEIVNAAKNAYAHGFISRMPKGYETIITESGGELSEGQKQLLAIARVMLLDPKILILDEATSSIDTRTEWKIQSALEQMMKGRTSFIVAHRLSTVITADQILVMEKGKIIEQGSHKELLKKNGKYSKLYASQFE